MLDNIIRFCADEIFRPFFDYDYCQSYSMKITCDAEYGVTDDIDLSRVEQMSEGLKQRLTAAPVRFVYDSTMSNEMLSFIMKKLGMDKKDNAIPGGRYHNFKDFIKFSKFNLLLIFLFNIFNSGFILLKWSFLLFND